MLVNGQNHFLALLSSETRRLRLDDISVQKLTAQDEHGGRMSESSAR